MRESKPSLFPYKKNKKIISNKFDASKNIVIYPDDCLKLLKSIPNESMQLVVTSPPYNIGKEYEKKLHLDLYLQQQAEVIKECVRVLSPAGRSDKRMCTCIVQ